MEENVQKTSCVSSPFYYQTRNRNCSSYMITKTNSLIGAKNTEEFNCTDSTTISSFLVDDLIPDCSSDVNDEIKLQNLLVNNSITTCINPGEIPCKQGHSKCFNISDICIYRLDQVNHLTPCRTAFHMHIFVIVSGIAQKVGMNQKHIIVDLIEIVNTEDYP